MRNIFWRDTDHIQIYTNTYKWLHVNSINAFQFDTLLQIIHESVTLSIKYSKRYKWKLILSKSKKIIYIETRLSNWAKIINNYYQQKRFTRICMKDQTKKNFEISPMYNFSHLYKCEHVYLFNQPRKAGISASEQS